MLVTNDLLGALILGAVFLLLLIVAEAWRRFGTPKPEWTRKLVHLGGGFVCLLFPFLIRSAWIVLAMALGLTAVFALAAATGALKSLHGVERPSRGAEYFPLAVWLVFFLTPERPWLYLSAVLVLAVGDASAALVGSRYGVLRYEVEDEHKSLEGSLVFLIIAFLAIHLPMLLMTDLPRGTCVLAALLVAILVTGFEAISLRGADNLFVPLAVVAILDRITTKPFAEVIFQNISLAFIILLTALFVARYPLLNAGSTIVFILYAYGNWSLASWQWAVPVFGGLACYMLLWVRVASPDRAPRLRVRVIARALLVPFLFLALANGTKRFDLMFGPYLTASAAVLAIGLITPLSRLMPHRGLRLSLGAAGIATIGFAATILPIWILQADVPVSAPLSSAALLLPVTFILVLVESREETPPIPRWTATRFLSSAAVAGAILLMQSIGITATWARF